MKPIISFILPIYNTEETLLRQCLNRLEQYSTIPIEIVLVDDGSSSTIKKIADEYVSDVRFHYYYQENQGVSAARNTGLRHAHSEWVFFLDPDDLLTQDSEKYFLNAVKDNKKTDMIIFSYSELDNQTQQISPVPLSKIVKSDNGQLLNPESLLLAVLRTPETKGSYSGYYLGMPWGKLIRREFLVNHAIEFPKDITKREDALFAVQVYSCQPRVSCEASMVYLYRTNNNDSLSKKYAPELPDMFLNLLHRLLKYEELVNDKQAFNESYSIYCFDLTKELVNLYYCNQNNPETYKERKQAFLNFRETEELLPYFTTVPRFNGPLWKKVLFYCIKNKQFFFLNAIYVLRKVRASL
ncbi:glycosyltransferase family 2 protein [Enterococcus phoeniculicola]|jgi:glycosyltransferase involved in cell wall biosynthesis|uniref:Glycosyltransferase 2-like domain-containing protein n=1 Tax=Enterococcus phoeniculicola ATCC BAA-412 TaxID=1158610 RepID=R3WIA1_9ENTE|nr:glycosyltransferase family A protein [Enterococcus phoeniculicola]EOL47546.1 hypothetical protein UC3_00549 [Enterococcus phoeniculicola ATCC BAA-412]EOT72841.1 hypothetical protein I589_03112 [Enterococcus phoeniculicola ATCC BAA-412]